MKLTKRESKYRLKIFNENHYGKEMQEKIDNLIGIHNLYPTYYEWYLDSITNLNFPILFLLYDLKITESMQKFGVVIRNADGSFRNTVDILEDLSNKWNQ